MREGKVTMPERRGIRKEESEEMIFNFNLNE